MDTCTPVITETLFTILKTWKQPKCQLTYEWIKKMWYIYTMEYCAVLYLVAQLYLTLCDLMDCSLPGSPVHGIFQARILEWVAIYFSRGSSWLRDRNPVSYILRYNLLSLNLGRVHNAYLVNISKRIKFILEGNLDWCHFSNLTFLIAF